MNTATFIRDLESNGPVVRASLYRVDPPMTIHTYTYDNDQEESRQVALSSEYVRVSASNVQRSGPETYIFLADDQGEPINWLECNGSYRGGLDHNEALTEAGYKIVENDIPLPNSTVVRLREIRDGLTQTFCDVHDLDVNPVHLPELLGYIAAAIVAVNHLFPEEEPA